MHALERAHPPYWQEARTHLYRTDAVLSRLIDRHGADTLRGSGDAFRTLINAIVGQQISVAAADSIWRRLLATIVPFEPHRLATTPPDQLRALGLSQRKAEYALGIAQAFASGSIDPSQWPQMDDETVAAQLTALRGVGPWTAHMMLIFHLHRPDVLPLGDIGLVNAAARLYDWEVVAPDLRSRQQRLQAHADRWRPYRTVATWFIWRDLDAEPVVY